MPGVPRARRDTILVVVVMVSKSIVNFVVIAQSLEVLFVRGTAPTAGCFEVVGVVRLLLLIVARFEVIFVLAVRLLGGAGELGPKLLDDPASSREARSGEGPRYPRPVAVVLSPGRHGRGQQRFFHGIASRDLLLHQLLDYGSELLGVECRVNRFWNGADDPECDLADVGSLEGRVQCCQLIDHHTPAPSIGSVGVRLLVDDLRAQVQRRAHTGFDEALLVERARNAKISEQKISTCRPEEAIFWLHISM
mmetsp:Transcript_54396/g.119070  ORF Transcript_54396/g.119070 Transcript_54396/m.119070 type:complete len:250 (+) Transcript_54396:488-1237(+)